MGTNVPISWAGELKLGVRRRGRPGHRALEHAVRVGGLLAAQPPFSRDFNRWHDWPSRQITSINCKQIAAVKAILECDDSEVNEPGALGAYSGASICFRMG